MSQVTGIGSGGGGGGGSVYAYTHVTTSPYVVLSSDVYLGVSTTGIPITIRLPNTATTGRFYIVKDRDGTSFTNHITVTTVGGVVLIDGLTSQTLNINYNSLQLLFNGTSWEIF